MQKQQLTAAGSHSQKGSPGKIILTQCETHGPSTLFLLPWVREVQITEQSPHCLCCSSCLCVSSELPWYQHKSFLPALDLAHRQGETCSSLPHSFLLILRHPFSLGCIHTFLCQEIPSCTKIHSAVFFHCWVLAEKDCIHVIYVIYVNKVIVSYSILPETLYLSKHSN